MSTWFKAACIFVFSIFVVSPMASTALADGHFEAGLEALQKNDLKTARTEFRSALQQNPSQAQVYYDLGLVEYKDNHPGLAIGLWRKALTLHPDEPTVAAALQFSTKKLGHPSIAHEAESWEAFHEALLAPTPLWKFLALANLLLLAAGWVMLSYFGKSKRARLNETPAPPPPFLGATFGVLCLIFFGLSAAKIIDAQTTRATVTLPTLAVRTAPDDQSASLYDLYEGLEVIVQQASNDWLQITYPGGMTGWVPKSSLIVTSGRAP